MAEKTGAGGQLQTFDAETGRYSKEAGNNSANSNKGYDSRDDFRQIIDRVNQVRSQNSGSDKSTQLAIINATNPAPNDTLTWIRSEDDIKTPAEIYEQALQDNDGNGNVNLAPDFSLADLKKAMQTGYITVYSSYPIKNGVFVTPSRMEASQYAGGGEVHSAKIPIGEVAWIDELQGQYAKPNGSDEYAPSKAKAPGEKKTQSVTERPAKEESRFVGDKYYTRGTEYEVINGMPDGWVKIDMTAPKGYVFASNNKSRFSGQRKTALIKL